MRSYLFVLAAASSLGATAFDPAHDALASAAQTAAERDGETLAAARSLLEKARVACAAPDASAARDAIASALEAVLELESRDASSAVTELLEAVGALGNSVGDHRSAQRAWSRALARREATLPEDDPSLQTLRKELAFAHWYAGDLETAERLLDVNLAVQVRTLSEDDPELAKTRYNLGNLCNRRDPQRAREILEPAVAAGERAGRGESADFQDVRAALAISCKLVGDLHTARSIEENVLDVLMRAVADDDDALVRARINLASTLADLGEIDRARELQETVLAIQSRKLADDDLDLQSARQNLAIVLLKQGELVRARALLEVVLQVRTRRLPDDHPAVQRARQNLAALMRQAGDFVGARLLLEKVLEVQARTLPDDHPDLQAARFNLAAAMDAQGDHAGARSLMEQVYEVRTRTLPDDHPYLQLSRRNLAGNYAFVGDFAAARPLAEKWLEVSERTLPGDHPDLQMARTLLADCLSMLGEHAAAKALIEAALESQSALPADDLNVLRCRQSLALILRRLDDRDELARVCRELAEGVRLAMTHAQAQCSPRELEARAVLYSQYVDTLVAIAVGSAAQPPLRELDRPLFAVIEAVRGASSTSARFMRRVRNSPDLRRLREDVRAASEAIATATREDSGREAIQKATMERDRAERALAQAAGASMSGEELAMPGPPDALTRHLRAEDALIGTWTAPVFEDEAATTNEAQRTRRVFAFVARAKGDVSIVSLASESKIETAVRAWRGAIGTSTAARGSAVSPSAAGSEADAGRDLARLIVDPLRGAAGEAARWIVAVDGVLSLVALDALPDGEGVLGDRVRVEMHTALSEIDWSDTTVDARGTLVALGGVAFDAEPRMFERAASEPASGHGDARALLTASTGASPSTMGWSLLRGTSFEQGFTPLPATAAEAEGVMQLRRATDAASGNDVLLEGESASRVSIEALVPNARYVHLATHGWLAPDSNRSIADAAPLDPRFRVVALSQDAQVEGLSPMVLCGLALAGANRPRNALDRQSALVTAEEISTWNLERCDLAVLSACDTNAGYLRGAGQGVASLQRALHMAGARSVITSLWKVPDEATKDLMLEFYRRIWIEKEPKHRALWEAKKKLRDATDGRGHARYATRDWGAWVLTGEPD